MILLNHPELIHKNSKLYICIVFKLVNNRKLYLKYSPCGPINLLINKIIRKCDDNI